MKVYKVVHVLGNGHKRSAFVRGKKTKTMYTVGKEITPRVGEVFAFDSVDNARLFVAGDCPTEIWEADTPSTRPAPFICMDRERIEIGNFLELYWGGRRDEASEVSGHTYSPPPSGSVLCPNITLIRRVAVRRVTGGTYE